MVSAWAADEARAAAFKVVVKRGLYEDAIVVPVGVCARCLGLRAVRDLADGEERYVGCKVREEEVKCVMR